jgi:hypothetical protein
LGSVAPVAARVTFPNTRRSGSSEPRLGHRSSPPNSGLRPGNDQTTYRGAWRRWPNDRRRSRRGRGDGDGSPDPRVTDRRKSGWHHEVHEAHEGNSGSCVTKALSLWSDSAGGSGAHRITARFSRNRTGARPKTCRSIAVRPARDQKPVPLSKGPDPVWILGVWPFSPMAQKSRSDGTRVARGFSPWTRCEFPARRGATPESVASIFLAPLDLAYASHNGRTSLRDANPIIHAYRGLKPTATLLLSLRDA